MTGRRTRVLWLTKSLGHGGTEQLLSVFARMFDRERFDVEVAYCLTGVDALVPGIRASGLTVHCLHQESALDPRWLFRLRRLIRQRDYDIVHSHMPVPAVGARLVAGRARPVVMHTEHNMWPRYRWPTYWSNALTYRRNNKVIAVSQAVADSVTRSRLRDESVMEVVRHGVDLSAISTPPDAGRRARHRLGLPESALVIGTVGNLTPKKDHRTLIDALRIVRQRRPDARLVIIGGGPLEPDLRRHAAHVGVGHAVTLTGLRDDVTELLPAFDLFAMSSLFEGLSIALVEALAVGLPVVVTKVGGMPEVVRDGVEGLLVRPADPSAMAAALERLADDRQLRSTMSKAGRRRAGSFDIRTSLHRLEQIYDELLATA